MTKEQNKGKCIFCGLSGNLTKGHVFSDFLGAYIPRHPTGSSHFALPSKFLPNDELRRLKPFKKENGDVGTKTVRNVCKSCNGGWISVIEGNVKPILTKLITGTATDVTDAEKLLLANWIVITSITAQYTVKDAKTIQSFHRTFIYENKAPADGWYIWIGKYSGNDAKIIYRNSAVLYYELDKGQIFDPTGISIEDNPDNNQLTVVILDQLIIIASTLPVLPVKRMFFAGLQIYRNQLVSIWPISNQRDAGISSPFGIIPLLPSQWPPSYSVDDQDFLKLSNILHDIETKLNTKR